MTPRPACRVPIFQPTRRPRTGTVIVGEDNQWGQAEIVGRLGQQHRDILDLLVHLQCGWRKTSEGDVVLLINSATLRGALGWDRWTYPAILAGLRDLENARIRLKVKNWPAESSRLVMRVAESTEVPPPDRKGSRWRREWVTPADPLNPRGGAIWEVMLSRAWIYIRKQETGWYPHNVITGLRHGVSQALARFMLSHGGDTQYKLETALQAVGVRRIDKAVREVLADAPGLAGMGLRIEGGTIKRVPPQSLVPQPRSVRRRAPRGSKTCPTTPEPCPITPEKCPITPENGLVYRFIGP